jgi:hypothetical protein
MIAIEIFLPDTAVNEPPRSGKNLYKKSSLKKIYTVEIRAATGSIFDLMTSTLRVG